MLISADHIHPVVEDLLSNGKQARRITLPYSAHFPRVLMPRIDA